MSDGIHGIKILKGKVHIMKTIEEFYSEAMADKELEVAVNKAHSENRLAEFLTEHGVDGTTEAFEALVKEKKQTRTELTDKELEEAVGGKYGYADWGVDWSDDGYESDKSKVKYLFNVGDKVIVDCWFRNLTGTVTERKLYCNDDTLSLMYCPEYYIVFDIDTSSDWYEQASLAPFTSGGAYGSF